MPLKELTKLLSSLAEAVLDQDFITQVLAINDDIGNMSAENWQSADGKSSSKPLEPTKEQKSTQNTESDVKKDDLNICPDTGQQK